MFNDDTLHLETVKRLPVLERYKHWVLEREKIRLRKEAEEPKPWTSDPILRDYRFCNVRRMDDKVSKWLYDNWYLPFKDHKHMLMAVALARFINKPSSLERITPEVFTDRAKINLDNVIRILRKHRDSGNVIFNGAYMVRGNDGIDKIECVTKWYVAPLEKVELNTDSMQASHASIQASYGMGSFMAGQIVADLRWALTGTWKDKMIWAPMGPGSQRGINRFFGREPKAPMGKPFFDMGIIAARRACLESLELKKISARLEAHDYQNTFCEWDKYERTLWGEGKPKQKYVGR